MPYISIIVARAQNNAIGRDNQLLYYLPNDLKRFKQLTTGHTIIMGRKTFESLPKGALPHRRNIVLSRNKGLSFPGAERYSSLEEALAHCADDEQVYIIGGGSIYRQALPMADKLCLTLIEATPQDADVFFPEIDPDEWEEQFRECHPVDDRHAVAYTFVDYIRKEKRERAE